MSDNVQTPREKRPTFMKGLFFLIIIGGLGAAIGLFALIQRPAEGPVVITTAPEPISVATADVVLLDTLSFEETFSGLAAARRDSTLGFNSAGRIAQINVDIGDRVSTGQTLARLDTRALQARLAAAEASIAEARAASTLAQTTVRRQSELFNRGHVAQQAVDEAVAEADSALARINAAQAQAETLKVDIELASISAPFAGTITGRMADEGAIASPGQTILELVEDGEVEARIGLPADAAATLVVGEAYELLSASGRSEATLRAITGVIDPQRRTVAAVFDITSPATVRAGAVVRLPLERTINERGFWAPVSALSEANRGLWSIYAVEREPDGDWVAARRAVEIVHAEGEQVFVRGTLTEGETFITGGLQRITPGQTVVPREALTAAK